MSDTEVGISAKLQGFDTAAQGIESLARQLQGLNGNVASPAGSSLPPLGGNSLAPIPPNPYSAPGSGVNPSGGGGSPYAFMGGFLPPMGGSPMAPGILAPGSPGVAPLGGGGGNMNGVITATTIQITATTVIVNGGGGGAGGAGGAGGQGGAGAIGNPVAPNPHAPASGQTGGPSWGSFFQRVAANPTISGVGNAVMDSLPLGVVAPAIGAMSVGSYLLGNELAGLRPAYETETGLMAARMRGTYVHPAQEAAASRAAQMQGEYAKLQSQFAPLNTITMGLSGQFLEATLGMRVQREVELLKAQGNADVQRAAIAGYTGAKILDLEGIPDMNTLGLRRAGSEMFIPFGTRSAAQFGGRTGLNASYSTMMREFGEEATTGVIGTVSRMGLDPQMMGMRADLRAGGAADSGANINESAAMMAARGDMAGLARLYPWFAANQQKGSFDSFAGTASGIADIQRNLQLSSAQYQGLRLSGAGYEALQQQGGVDVQNIGSQIAAAIKLQGGLPAERRGDMDVLIQGLRNLLQEANIRVREDYYGQQTTTLQAGGISAGTTYSRALFSGAGATELGGFARQQGDVLRQEAALLRQQAQEGYKDPATKAMLLAQADAKDFQAGPMTERGIAQTGFGISLAQAGQEQARIQGIQSRAQLFGSVADIGATMGLEAGPVQQQLAAIGELLRAGNLTQEEIARYTGQQTSLQTQLVQIQAESVRGGGRLRFESAQAMTGLARGAGQLAYMTGTGGAAGFGFAEDVAGRSQEEANRAQQQIDILRGQGVADDNPEMLRWKQQLQQSQMGTVQANMGFAQVPAPIGMQRQLSGSQYAAQVLSSVPGGYGNMRGALQGQVNALEQIAAEKQKNWQQTIAHFGGEDKVPEYVKFAFQQEFQQIGLQQAGAAQQLAYGWESRMISAAWGTGGNISAFNNRFSYREAVGSGVRNPHMGSTGSDLPFYIRYANEVGSIAGATGTPEGFAVSALTGQQGRMFGRVAGVPNFAGGALMPPGAADAHPKDVTIHIMLQWPDGSSAGQKSVKLGDKNYSLGANEDLVNIIKAALGGHQ